MIQERLDSLAPAEATEIPAQVIEAVRSRRRQRRVRLAGRWGALAAVGLAVVWAVYPAGPGARQPIATRPDGTAPLPAPVPPDPVPAPPRDAVAWTYGAMRDSDLDRLASASPAGEERPLRIGDHWDLDRVKAWVLD
jgi:hypothetical protein